MMLMLQEGCNHSADSGSAVHFKNDHRCRRPAGVCGGGDGARRRRRRPAKVYRIRSQCGRVKLVVAPRSNEAKAKEWQGSKLGRKEGKKGAAAAASKWTTDRGGRGRMGEGQ